MTVNIMMMCRCPFAALTQLLL